MAGTLQRWIARHEAQGVGGLANARPWNAGQRRVAVSRAFDKAALLADLDPWLLREIGEDLERALKGLWASRAEAAGWREIRRLAQTLLREACDARALSLPLEAFHLSRRRVCAFPAGNFVLNTSLDFNRDEWDAGFRSGKISKPPISEYDMAMLAIQWRKLVAADQGRFVRLTAAGNDRWWPGYANYPADKQQRLRARRPRVKSMRDHRSTGCRRPILLRA